MNKRIEKKLTDLSGMNRAVNEILQQAWERGRKYGNEEGEGKGDLISREALKKEFAYYGEKAKFTQGSCQQLIDNAPTVELQMGRMTNGIIIPIERTTGKWIRHISSIECSVCKEKFFSTDEDENCQDYDPCLDYNFNYCPNCGARMITVSEVKMERFIILSSEEIEELKNNRPVFAGPWIDLEGITITICSRKYFEEEVKK